MMKELAIQTIQELPENADIKEIIEVLYLKYRALQGVEDIKSGNYISSDELKKEIEKW